MDLIGMTMVGFYRSIYQLYHDLGRKLEDARLEGMGVAVREGRIQYMKSLGYDRLGFDTLESLAAHQRDAEERISGFTLLQRIAFIISHEKEISEMRLDRKFRSVRHST